MSLVYMENKKTRHYYLSLFGQFFMIFFAFKSLLYEDASPARVRILTVNLVFFLFLAMYTVKKLLEMAEDINHPASVV